VIWALFHNIFMRLRLTLARFVNNLRRNPLLIEYTSHLKTLDCIYLDTSFTDSVHFPTKANGLVELLQKVAKYPPDTTFHLTAWTFGYEEVWLALSKALNSQVSAKLPQNLEDYFLTTFQTINLLVNCIDRFMSIATS
jgi:hypothetical protein